MLFLDPRAREWCVSVSLIVAKCTQCSAAVACDAATPSLVPEGAREWRWCDDDREWQVAAAVSVTRVSEAKAEVRRQIEVRYHILCAAAPKS